MALSLFILSPAFASEYSMLLFILIASSWLTIVSSIPGKSNFRFKLYLICSSKENIIHGPALTLFALIIQFKTSPTDIIPIITIPIPGKPIPDNDRPTAVVAPSGAALAVSIKPPTITTVLNNKPYRPIVTMLDITLLLLASFSIITEDFLPFFHGS